jgi:hypothetical protein
VSDTHDEIRALRVMVDELKAEPVPELPWDAIEQKLLARVEQRDRATARDRARWLRPGTALTRSLGVCAAAAAIALGVSGFGQPSDGSPLGSRSPQATPSGAHQAEPRHVDVAAVALAPRASKGERDLGALAVGDIVESGDAPIAFARAGLVAWTLAPHSAVRVRSMGDATSGVGHTVALERGSIRAEVTPRDPSEGLVEAFAVEVGKTRVAVHGTAFSVSMTSDRAIVDVEHGAVAVGPVGHIGATTAHLLVGPKRASFSLDGGRTALLLPRDPSPSVGVRIAALPPTAPAAPPPAQASEPVPAPIAEPPAHVEPVARARQPQPVAAATPPAPKPEVAEPVAPAAPPLLTVASVRARLQQCFRSTYEPGSSSVQISVSSTLRVSVNPDGSVRSARFDPPLKPEMVGCAGGIMGGRFAEGTGNVDIPVSYRP